MCEDKIRFVEVCREELCLQDLKSANILLSRDGSAKIADVGLAKIMSRELTQVSARGSFDWVAPEVCPLSFSYSLKITKALQTHNITPSIIWLLCMHLHAELGTIMSNL